MWPIDRYPRLALPCCCRSHQNCWLPHRRQTRRTGHPGPAQMRRRRCCRETRGSAAHCPRGWFVYGPRKAPRGNVPLSSAPLSSAPLPTVPGCPACRCLESLRTDSQMRQTSRTEHRPVERLHACGQRDGCRHLATEQHPSGLGTALHSVVVGPLGTYGFAHEQHRRPYN